MLKDKIKESLLNAMLARNQKLVDVLRSIVAKITEAEKSNNNIILDDEQVLKVIEKLSKQRQESIDLFIKGNRQDLVETEQYQLDVLKTYLPQKFTYDETKDIVQNIINSSDKENNVGSVMKELKRYGSLIDNKVASVIASQLLNGK